MINLMSVCVVVCMFLCSRFSNPLELKMAASDPLTVVNLILVFSGNGASVLLSVWRDRNNTDQKEQKGPMEQFLHNGPLGLTEIREIRIFLMLASNPIVPFGKSILLQKRPGSQIRSPLSAVGNLL